MQWSPIFIKVVSPGHKNIGWMWKSYFHRVWCLIRSYISKGNNSGLKLDHTSTIWMVPRQRAYVVCVCKPSFRNYWTRHDIAVCVKVDNFAVIQCVESISCFYIPTKIKRELLSYLFFFWPNVSIDKADFSLPSSIIAIWNIY